MPSPHPWSTEALRSLNAQDTAEVWLLLLTLEHNSLAEPLRFTSDAVPTPSRGQTYIPFPFRMILPNAQADQVPQASLRIDNVDRRVSEILQQIDSAASLRVELILASAPDTVERDYGRYQLSDVKVTLTSIEARLGLNPWAQEPVGWLRFTPGNFPGLVA